MGRSIPPEIIAAVHGDLRGLNRPAAYADCKAIGDARGVSWKFVQKHAIALKLFAGSAPTPAPSAPPAAPAPSSPGVKPREPTVHEPSPAKASRKAKVQEERDQDDAEEDEDEEDDDEQPPPRGFYRINVRL